MNFDERGPIYAQIAHRIKEDIISGKLHEEEQVLSPNQYAAFYQINPATAAKAFELLEEEGILHEKRGLGRFVSRQARIRLLRERRERFFKQYVDPMLEEAFAIGITPEEIASYMTGPKGGTHG
ncbi:GntR family transcriptional regulator [Paenibacillus xanthanilyticus]|uniref:GntR family transcriptional regulator n=1 Tax=Paenibacillus xanthanilyticus TaxID=1783531 RepID=A0ABV8KAW3_9BACL